METSRKNDKATQLAHKAVEAMSPGALYAFVVVAKNLKTGVFWGFTDLNSVKEHVNEIKSDPNLKVRKVGEKDCIVEVQPDYVLKNIVTVAPDAFSQQDLNKMQKNMGEAYVQFEKFLCNKGIAQEGFGSTIGIYSTNNVTSISYKGIAFPAFRLNMEMALNILAECGYLVKVGGQLVPAQQAMQMGEALWKSTKFSPTKTGIFINIKSGLSSAQLKEVKKCIDARYKTK